MLKLPDRVVTRLELQVWQGDQRLLNRQGLPEMGDRLTPDAQRFESAGRWLYVQPEALALGLVVPPSAPPTPPPVSRRTRNWVQA